MPASSHHGAELRQVVVVRHVDAALALDRLDEHGARCFGPVAAFTCLDVVERHADEALRQRRERRAVRLVRGRRDRGQRAAVERALHDDDLVGAVALLLAPLAGELDQPLDGLRAAVAEERLVHAAARAQQLGQLELRDRVVVVRGRASAPSPAARSPSTTTGWQWPRLTHGDAADEVQVRLAVDVPDRRRLRRASRITGRRLPVCRKYFFSVSIQSCVLRHFACSHNCSGRCAPSIRTSSACSSRPSTITARQPRRGRVQARLDLRNHTAFDHAGLHQPSRPLRVDSSTEHVAVRLHARHVRHEDQPDAPSAAAIAPAAVSALMLSSWSLGLAAARTAGRSAPRRAPRPARSADSSTASGPRSRSRRRSPSASSAIRQRSSPPSAPVRPTRVHAQRLQRRHELLVDEPASTATTTSSDASSVTRRPFSKRVGTSRRFSQSLIIAPAAVHDHRPHAAPVQLRHVRQRRVVAAQRRAADLDDDCVLHTLATACSILLLRYVVYWLFRRTNSSVRSEPQAVASPSPRPSRRGCRLPSGARQALAVGHVVRLRRAVGEQQDLAAGRVRPGTSAVFSMSNVRAAVADRRQDAAPVGVLAVDRRLHADRADDLARGLAGVLRRVRRRRTFVSISFVPPSASVTIIRAMLVQTSVSAFWNVSACGCPSAIAVAAGEAVRHARPPCRSCSCRCRCRPC